MGVAACLLLEYGVSTAAVAVGWSQYLNKLFAQPLRRQHYRTRSPRRRGTTSPASSTCPPIVLVVMCMLLLIRGASESAKVNTVMVLIKLGVLAMFSRHRVHRVPRPITSPTSPRWASRPSVSAAGHDLLLLHRPRRRVDCGRRGQESAEDHAAGHHRRAADRHQRLRPGGHSPRSAPRTGPMFDGQEAGLAQILDDVTGCTLLEHRARRGRGHLDLLGHPGDDVRPDPHPVRDGPRRSAAVDVRQGQPEEHDAGEQHHHRGDRGVASWPASSRWTSSPTWCRSAR